MAVRGGEHRAAIRAVLDAFGPDARHFVFVGGCTLGLYARSEGAPFRATKDVDCISILRPWVLQERVLGEMCNRGILTPDRELQCRYRLRGTELDVDVLSPDGFNVGGVNPWFARAAERAIAYDVGEGRSAMAVTPPYFLMTKLVAFEDRGPDAQSSKDVEDIVALLVEVADLVDQVDAESLRTDAAHLWHCALAKHSVRTGDLPDLVDWHLDAREALQRDRVVAMLVALVGDSPT